EIRLGAARSTTGSTAGIRRWSGRWRWRAPPGERLVRKEPERVQAGHASPQVLRYRPEQAGVEVGVMQERERLLELAARPGNAKFELFGQLELQLQPAADEGEPDGAWQERHRTGDPAAPSLTTRGFANRVRHVGLRLRHLDPLYRIMP